MGLLTMFDAVTVGNLPATARYVALYVDGQYANLPAGKARCPHAEVLTITVTGGAADCCDCEAGDLTPAQAEAWVAERLAAGQYRPCVYANAATWSAGLEAALAKYGSRIRRWTAAYPGAGATVPAGFDAHQYAGGVTAPYDTSVCLADFFDGPPPPVHEWSAELQLAVPEGSTGVARFHGSVDLATGGWVIDGSPGIVHWSGSGGGNWRIKGLPLNAPPLGG